MAAPLFARIAEQALRRLAVPPDDPDRVLRAAGYRPAIVRLAAYRPAARLEPRPPRGRRPATRSRA